MMGYARKEWFKTAPLMSLHWLPIEQRIEFKLLLFTYKALHDTAPSYIKDMLEPYVPHRHLRSAKKMQDAP